MQPTDEYQTTGFYPNMPEQRRRGPNWRNACLALTGALFAFICVAGVVSAIIFPPIYRNMEPLDQEIWCNRAESIGASFVCDWKPTPPFEVLPTLETNPNSTFSADDLLLTPFDFSEDDGSATPVSQLPPELQTHTPQVVASDQPTRAVTAIPATATIALSTATPTLAPPPQAAQLNMSNLRWEKQGWNNCGPTTLTMGLTYFGYQQNQWPAANYLKPNIEDKNVSPWQMIDFVNQTAVNIVGTKAIYRVGGDLDLLKRLIANDFPVIIEKGYEPPGYDWMGHYLLMVGYDDSQQVFMTYDSFGGKDRRETYDYVSNYWRHFANTYIVLYPAERESELARLLGPAANPDAAVQEVLRRAQEQANANSMDKWAWVNMAEALVMLDRYEEAASAYDQALRLNLPWRLTWYRFGAFQAYYHVGRYDDVIRLANTLDQSSGYYVEEAWYYRGLAQAAKGDTQAAIRDFQRVLAFNQNYGPATVALTEVQNGTFTAPVSFSR